MKFSVDPKIFASFTGLEIGVLVVTGMNNDGISTQISILLKGEEECQSIKLSKIDPVSLSEIMFWRKLDK